MTKLFTIAAVAALAACSKEASAPANDQADAGPTVQGIAPGLYRQATTLLELKDSSLSAEQAAAAAAAIGTPETAERCVTADMVKDPQALFREDSDPNCTIKRSHWDGGRIDFAMTCPDTDAQMGGSMALRGTYDAKGYRFELDATGAGDDRMRMRVDAERLGDCAT